MSAKGGTGGFLITGEACACCGSVRGTTPGCVCTHEWGMGIGGSAADWKGKAIGGYVDAPPMKASEITQDGYYWAWAVDSWDIVSVSDGRVQYADGSIERLDRLQFEYEVIGPLKPPPKPAD